MKGRERPNLKERESLSSQAPNDSMSFWLSLSKVPLRYQISKFFHLEETMVPMLQLSVFATFSQAFLSLITLPHLR